MTAPILQTVLADWTGVEAPGNLLGARERRYATGLPPWRRQEWTATRLTGHAAIHLAGCHLDGPAEILTNPDGAPRVEAGSAPSYSLSLAHSGPLAACAVAAPATAIGVDVEREDDRNARLLRRISGANEIHAPETATVVWACKEAALKACRRSPGRMTCYRVNLRTDPAEIGLIGETSPVMLTAWVTRLPGAVLVSAGHQLTEPHSRTITGTGILELLTDARRRAGTP